MTNDKIKTLALDCGFTEKPQENGEMDLNPYVYESHKKAYDKGFIDGSKHSEWVPCRERLPEPYQNVLLFKSGNLNGKPVKYSAIGFIDCDGYWAYDDIFGKHLYKVPTYTTGSDLADIEFWQPLPQPPNEVQSD